MNNNANRNTNSNSPEGEGSRGEPPFFVPFQVPQVIRAPRRHGLTPAVLFGLHEVLHTPQLFTDLNSGEEHSEHGSDSSESDKDIPAELLCDICSRRHECIRFVVCGHGACSSCTKKTWRSRINRPDRARDPWPVSIPCPFCRAEVTTVIDERENVVASACSTVSRSEAPHLSSAENSGDVTEVATGGAASGTAAAVGGQETLIADWIVRNSQDEAWRLRLDHETAEYIAAAGDEASSSGGGRDWRGWNNEESRDWNEGFFE